MPTRNSNPARTHCRSSRLVGIALLLTLLGGLFLPTDRAEATTLRLEQHWRDPLFDSNGQSVRTVTFFEDDSLTGTGTEEILVDMMGVTEFLFGVAQHFNWAQFTIPPNFTTDFNIFARYVDGVFVGIQNVDTNGASLTPLGPTISPASDSGLRISTGFGQISYGPTLFLNILDLHSTEFTVVPEPAGLALVALCALGLRRASG